MSPRIVTFSNQKGGVGKTTLTLQIGHYLAHTGKKTLLVDTDPQANLTKSLLDETAPGLYEALNGSSCELQEVSTNLSILTGDVKLSLLEKSLVGEIDAYTRIKELLADELFTRYEYILLDTPPSLGVMALNALTAAERLIIPMSPSLYSMQGTNDLMSTVTKVRKNLNPDLQIAGVIINSFDSIPVITRQIKQEIRDSFGEMVFDTALSKSIRIEEAIASRAGVITNHRAKVSGEIKKIGEELIERLEGR